MLSRLAARRRAAPVAAETRAAAPGVYVTAADLAALEGQARHLHLRPRHPAHHLLAGRHASKLRGRGLDFEELRQYQQGDDVRTIDWRVTARMSKPFVRVHTEEKDRPALVVVDQRVNMFFGTKLAMKSVTAAQAAAICAWRFLGDGDRVGGVVFDDGNVYEERVNRNRGSVMRLITRIAACNQALTATSTTPRNPQQLDNALDAVARTVSHDHVVVIVTDSDGQGPRTRELLRRIALRNDVVLFLVYDPFLTELPGSRDLVVTNGELQMEVPMGSSRVRKAMREVSDRRTSEILGWRHDIGVTVAPLSAAEDTAAQLRHFLGRTNAGPRAAG